MRILIPLDGSPLAEQALVPAARIAKATLANSIILLRAFDMQANSTAGTGPMGVDQHRNDAVTACEDYLRQVAASPLLAGIDVTTRARVGNPAAVICAVAQEERAGLIMLTSHGRHGRAQPVLGGVAASVGRESHVPTLILPSVGDPAQLLVFDRHEPLVMLVPLDGSVLAEEAIDPAQRLAHALHATIVLVRILPDQGTQSGTFAPTNAEAYEYLTPIHDRLEKAGITTHRELAWGHPTDAIIATATRVHAHLIAMATHGRSGSERWLMGSVTESVLHHSNLPVMILHPAPISENVAVEAQHLP